MRFENSVQQEEAGIRLGKVIALREMIGRLERELRHALDQPEPKGADVDARSLMGSMSAATWAAEFVKFARQYPRNAFDVPTMLSWFSAAIMVGYDRGRADERDAIRREQAQARVMVPQNGTDERASTAGPRDLEGLAWGGAALGTAAAKDRDQRLDEAIRSSQKRGDKFPGE